MASSDVPESTGVPNINQTGLFTGGLGLTGSAHRPMFREGFGPQSLGQSYERPDQQPGQGNFRRDFLDKFDDMNKKKVEDAEDVDVRK